MLKWLPAVITLSSFVLSLALYPLLPETIPLGLERLLPVDPRGPAETVPRFAGAFMLPFIAALLLLLLHEAPVRSLGRAAGRLFATSDSSGHARPVEYHKFAQSYRLIVCWVVMLPIAMQLGVLSNVFGWGIEPGTIVGITFGVGLVVIGNIMPRLRPNPVAGVRTARTMSDPLLWARVHRWYGSLWMIAGALVLVVAIAVPRYALLTAVVALLLSSVAALMVPRGVATPSSSRG